MNLNVLQKAKKVDVVMHPFPHLIIENALPDDIYNELDNTWPTDFLMSDSSSLTDEKGHTKRYLSAKVLEENTVSQLWKDFFTFHTSNDFYHYAIDLLSDAIKEYYPEQADLIINSSASPRTQVNQKNSSTPFVTDCQFVQNNPLVGNETSRTPHLDNPQEIYAALFYMKSKDDNSAGRDLEIYSSSSKFPSLGKKRTVVDEIKLESTCPYRANTLLLFLNCRHGIHGVSPSLNAKKFRRHINIIGEYGNGTNLFSL